MKSDEPFTERFWRIPQPMVEEVRGHMKEMLEAGAIHPSQSPWCNVIVLVRKKDGGLDFCIDFCRLNARTKKDSYPLPHIQEAIESIAGAGYFSCLDLKLGFWQITMDKVSKQYTTFTVGNLGFFWVWINTLWVVQCTCDLPEVNAELYRWIEPNMLLNILQWCDCFL